MRCVIWMEDIFSTSASRLKSVVAVVRVERAEAEVVTAMREEQVQ